MATRLPRKRFLLILVLLTASAQTSTSVFQCQFSSEPSGFLYTPNIPDSYFNDENYRNNEIHDYDDNIVTGSQNGFTYIITFPSESVQRNCSGRVVSIQYCYQARNSDIDKKRHVFNLLSLVQEPVQNGVQFTVNSRITIQTTPEDSICSDPPGGIQQICCDTTFLSSTDQFQIPPSTYTFGVMIINNNVKPLAFANTVTEYRVEQYQGALGNLPPGSMFTLTENSQVNRSLLLLRFLIGETSPLVFQCQFSSEPSGFLYIPNIPDSYFNDENYRDNDYDNNIVTESQNGFTYVFTLPSESVQRNCSGRVESIQYCYQAKDSDIGQTRDVFKFLSLVQEPVEDGVQFTVNSSITIQTTPEDSICTDPPGMIQQICCDITFLSATNQFHIPPSTYKFGVEIINNNVKPLAFANTVTEYRVEQYQASFESSPSPGNMFTLTENNQVNQPLLLLRFPIGQTHPLVFQCQFSSEPSGFLYTPNIPDSYFNDENYRNNEIHDYDNNNMVTGSRDGVTYVFTLPSESVQRNCSGRVDSIQYCYQARDNNRNKIQNVFKFLSLVQEPVQDEVQFTVNSSITIQSTPKDSICSDPPGNIQQICCDSTSLSATDQFQIPPSTYTFGVEIINKDVKPLVFTNRATEYRTSLGSSFPSGNMFTLKENIQVNQPLLLLRLSIVPMATTTEMVTEPATTAELVTNVPTVTEPVTTAELVTNVPTVTEPVTTAEPVSNEPTVTEPVTTAEPITNAPTVTEPVTTAEPVTNVPTTVPEPATTAAVNNDASGSNSNSDGAVGGAVGGAIGVCVALLAIITVTCVVVVVVIKHRKRREVISLENAVYGIDSAQNRELRGSNDATYEYADSGPQVYSKLSHQLGGVEDQHKNVYADIGASYEVPTKVSVNSGELLDEDIYMVPANEESELYAQLQNITTGELARHFVKLGDLLGSGQFGMVYKGVLQSAGGEVEVAVKTLKEGSDKEDRVKFLQEAAIMGQFKHPNVVTMYGVVTDGEPILLVLELLRKGDLRDHLIHMRNGDEDGSVNVDDHTLLSYCRQVASGMAYLSSKDFVHRDLAARNILVSDDEICKIADFGMSRDLMDESYYVSHGGKIPVKWTATEALHYKKYSTASDVWSYGALLYEIWSVGHKPFESFANAQVLKLIETGSRLSPPPGCPRAIYTIMISCWNPVASQRPKFVDITQQLSLPDTKLLKWSEEDKSVHPDATKLGADLLCTQELYKDLQTHYQRKS